MLCFLARTSFVSTTNHLPVIVFIISTSIVFTVERFVYNKQTCFPYNISLSNKL